MRTRLVMNGRPQWIVFDPNSPLSYYAVDAPAGADSTSFVAPAPASFDAAAAAAVAFEEGIADEYEDDPAAYEEAALFDNHVAALFEEANASCMGLMNDSPTPQNVAIASAVAATASTIVAFSTEVLPAVTSSLSVNAAAASPESVKFAFPSIYQTFPPIANPMNFPIENYEQLSVIRHGRNGDVIKARESTTGMIVAVKRFMIYGWSHPKSTAQDISLFKSLFDSKYMAKLLNVKQLVDGNAYFVFEYLQYNLKEAMAFHNTEMLTFDSRPETAERIRILMYQLCKAILYLHDNGIIHSALRPDNILVDMMTYRLKIADFNPGKTFNIIHNQREDTDKILTLKYIPPEILLGAPHSTQGDMWNVGLIFAELLRGRKLFGAHVKVTSKAEQLKIIFSILGTPTEETWPRVGKIMSKYNYYKHEPFVAIIPAAGTYGFDLLMKMLYYDPSRRISAKEALDHPYFDSINKSEFN